MTTTQQREAQSSVLSLFTGVYNYLKGLKFLDTVLPKGKSPDATTKSVPKTDATTNATTTKDTTTKDTNNEATERSLFPKKIIIDNETLKDSTAVACSTNAPSKLVKVENLDGSITWGFDHDQANTNLASFSTMTSPFLTSTGSTTSSTFSPLLNLNSFAHKDSPSPLAMEHHHAKVLTTHTSDVDSANSLEEELVKIPDLPNPEFFDIEDEEGSEEESDASIDVKTGKKKTKCYTCEFCGAEFRIRGYLTRHVKKHALNKAYECPFFDDHAENKCHPNGGFSRRDTYKTHLKARHFKYPPGTRSQDRAITAGKCGLCNKPYESNEDWVEKHIEGGECEALPKGYTGRVKNSRRKNYEYPNPQQISPISSNSNDSPMTSRSSPHNLVLPTGGAVNSEVAQDSISGLANLTPATNSSIPSRSGSAGFSHAQMKFGALQFQDFNEYDNDDEYSLDVEQCMNYTPSLVQGYSY